MKKSLIIALVISPLMLFSQEIKPTVEQLFNVQTIKVKKEKINLSKEYFGYTKINQENIYDLSPRFSGYVEELYKNKIYQKVKEGEKIAKIYSKEVYKSKEEYLNSFLFNNTINSKDILKNSKLKLELLQTNKKEINQILKDKKVSPYTYIYSPVNGYIFEKNVNNGSAFKASQKIMSIVDLKNLWVEISIFEKDRQILKNLNNFSISFKGIKQKYKATDFELYPMIDSKSPTLTARIQIDNKDGKLIPGMYSKIKINAVGESFLTVPNTAVIRKNSKMYVFLSGEYEGEYEPIEVVAERIDDNNYKIISGLEEGEEVVNNSLFMIDSDAQINGLY